MNFRENFKKDMKKCDHHIADLRKQLASRYASVEKVRGQACAGGGRGKPPLGEGVLCYWERFCSCVCAGTREGEAKPLALP